MNTPAFVQVWTNSGRKRFYIFKEELLCVSDKGVAVAVPEDEQANCIRFTSNGNGIKIEAVDKNGRMMLAGAWRSTIEARGPLFFSFKNHEFFLDNVPDHTGDFSITGVDVAGHVGSALVHARSDDTVFIIGDTGTGKEILARNIHYNGPRRHEPFVVHNCASFDDGVAEMELFGNTRGAYTNAMDVSRGAFMSAGKGTLLLDEIGNLPASVQPMLLRAIESREIRAVGSDVTRHHSARVIVTSNTPPAELLASGRLRQDLFYRIETSTVYLPGLRGMEDTVMELARFYAGDHCHISDNAKRMLVSYSWPGNIRELRNVIHRAIFMLGLRKKLGQTTIDGCHLLLKNSKDEDLSGVQYPCAAPSFAQMEEDTVKKALARNGWSIGRACRELGICRSTLLAKVKTYGIVKY